MSNLVRGPQDYLLNSLTGLDAGFYFDSKGLKHLTFKNLGIDIPENAGQTAVIKTGQAGQKEKITLTPNFLWNGEKSVVFDVEVTHQPLYTGFGNDQFPVAHTYSYKMTTFTTIVAGTLLDADKDTIINGLIATIALDVPRTSNAVLTGAVVVGTNVAQKLVLEASKVGILFTVHTFEDAFTQVLTTPYKKATYTDDDIFRLFAPHPDQAGQRVIVPTAGVPYACISIVQKTLGYENVSASASTTRDQVINIYVPATAIAGVEFATATDAGTNAASMADVVAVKAKTIKDYLILLLDAGNVTN